MLAAVVSLESHFEPLAIRINSGPPLASQPTSKEQAIEIAASLLADRQDIQIGLGGMGKEELRRLKLSISEAFDPCLNLKATATLLGDYYRLAVRAGADGAQAETIMLQSYYGRDDPSVGKMINYDVQVRQEMSRLSPNLASVTIGEPGQKPRIEEPAGTQEASSATRFLPQTDEIASWDVFNTQRGYAVLVFQNERSEQSE